MSEKYLKYAEAAFAENTKIRGHIARIDDKRFVFLGKHEDDKDTFCLGFENLDGEQTRLKVSKEAMAALVNLYTHPRKSDPEAFPLKIMTQWLIVEKPENDNTTHAENLNTKE